MYHCHLMAARGIRLKWKKNILEMTQKDKNLMKRSKIHKSLYLQICEYLRLKLGLLP